MDGSPKHSLSDQRALRRGNLSLVLTALREGPRSRARLADDLGLNKATVSSLVGELLDRGLAREGQSVRGGVGRPGIVIELDGAGVCGVSAEINVHHVATLALNLSGEVISERRASIAGAVQSPAEVLQTLAGLLDETLADVAQADAVVTGIVVGFAGLVDREHARLSVSPNLGTCSSGNSPEWADLDVAAHLEEALTTTTLPHPPHIDIHNEANLAAVAEAREAEPEGRDIVVVHGEVGIGGGIVAGGRRFDGARGYAGEFGHMAIDPNGRECGCGRIGCWETTIGFRRLLDLVADEGDPLLADHLDIEERIAEIDRRAEAGDERTLAALAEIAGWLAKGMAILSNVLNPGVIVLGGYLAPLGHRLVELIDPELRAGVIAPDIGGTTVQISTLGFSASVRGGALVALDRVFEDPTQAPRLDELGAIS